MLRVAMHGNENDSTIRIEGRLTHEYANQVQTLVPRRKTSMRLLVDLTKVSFVDPVGEAVLLWLKHVGARFAAENSYPRDVCERLHLPLMEQRAGVVRPGVSAFRG